MESKEEEARRAMDIAEKKLLENDYAGAKKFINKAQSLYPNLDGLNQASMMIDVFICASNPGEADWYGILGVDPSADDETVKRHYKKLALLLHPDKNRFHGAEEAFKLISEAWCLLSDKEQREYYEEKMKSKQFKNRKQQKQKQPKPQEPDSWFNPKPQKPKKPTYSNPNPTPEPKVGTFWTVCNKCKTYCEFSRGNYLNKILPCPNCGQEFVTGEIIPEIINGRPLIRMSPFVQSTSKRASYNAKTENQTQERVKRWFQVKPTTNDEPCSSSNKPKTKVSTFWTVCNTCKTYYELVRAHNHLNKTMPCSNCGQCFFAIEIIPEIINGCPIIRLCNNFQSTSLST